ncbi:MAG: EamA family transporter [Luteimonas sp.]|nr:EamA family transporter [Luteimonas sp.]
MRALLSACFAAITAVLAKLGVKDVDSDLAMAIRAVIVAAVITPFVVLAGKWSNSLHLSGRALLFLALSALTTGASWLPNFRALQLGEALRVAPIDKFSVVLVAMFALAFPGERVRPRLGGDRTDHRRAGASGAEAMGPRLLPSPG